MFISCSKFVLESAVSVLFLSLSITTGCVAAGLHRASAPQAPSETCVLSPEEICFGDVKYYSVEENSVARPLGRLGPGRCGNTTASYIVREGQSYVSVWDGELWSLPALDREADLVPPIQISCLLGSARYDRLVTLDVQDLDDNLPLLPTVPVVLQWLPNSTEVGPIELIDLDTVEVNDFKVDIQSDFLDVPKVHFSVRPTTLRNLEGSIISIWVILKPGGSYYSIPYDLHLTISDANHVLPNTVSFPLQLRRPPPAPLSQTRPTVQYPTGPLYITRAASLHARVTQPLGVSKTNFALPEFSLRHPALNVTRQAGIVYVSNTSALQRLPRVFQFTVEWSPPVGRQVLEVQLLDTTPCLEHDFVDNLSSVRVFRFTVEWSPPVGRQVLEVELVDTTPCLEHDHLDNLCSALTQKECLKTSCAYGLGALLGPNQSAARCHWVQFSSKSSGYSTCTADPPSCPDDWCDPLERLTGNLTCLQDCTQSVLGAGRFHWEVGHGIRPLTSSTFCSCDHFRACYCMGMTTNTTSTQRKVPKNLMAKPVNTTLMANATVVSKSTQTVLQVNTTSLPLMPDSKTKRKDGCGFKCQTKAAIGIIFIMSSCLFFLLFLSARKQKQKNNRKVFQNSNTLLQTLEAHRALASVEFPLDTFSPTCLPVIEPFIVPDPRWEVPRESLVIEQCLGEGEFGRVLKARARDIDFVKGETIVAVKTLKANATPGEMADLLAEYQMMKDVCHPHVIRLLGACTSQGGPVYIIIEYAEHGSLRTYLRRSRLVSPDPVIPAIEPVSFKTLLTFAWQISKGMAYLAENKLVHRDLAARNVLLATGLLCKVSDFGLSRDVYEDEAYLKRSKGRVPVKWMAAESLADRVYTTKSDVWSYGVVLWELSTLGSSPYPGVAAHNLFHLLKTGYRMPKPHTCTDSLYELMLSCWHEDPMERPPFWQITDRLEKMLEEGTDYLPLQLEKRLVINRSYLAEFSPEEDVDFTNEELGYKVPKLQSTERELVQTSSVKRYENEEVPKIQTSAYDTPRRVRHVSPPQSLVCSNNLGLSNYSVLQTKKGHSYQNDTQLNIDLSSDEAGNCKDSKYEMKKMVLLNTNPEQERETSSTIGNSSVGYVSMDTVHRRASSDEAGPSRLSNDTRRASSVEPGPSRMCGVSSDIRRASSAFPGPNKYTLSNLTEEITNEGRGSNKKPSSLEEKHKRETITPTSCTNPSDTKPPPSQENIRFNRTSVEDNENIEFIPSTSYTKSARPSSYINNVEYSPVCENYCTETRPSIGSCIENKRDSGETSVVGSSAKATYSRPNSCEDNNVEFKTIRNSDENDVTAPPAQNVLDKITATTN